MKKILFIIPNLLTGGTNSSLDALYSRLKERYDIGVFSMSHVPRTNHYSFDEAILKEDSLISLIFSDFACQKGVRKADAFVIKVLRYLCRILGWNFGTRHIKRVIRRIEDERDYNCIIGFQEGNATFFASLFSNTNKIAWIHCNYDQYLPQGQSEETLYASFKSIVCVSNYTATVFSRRYPGLAGRTVSIHNLIDSDRIRLLAESPIDDIQLILDSVTMLSVGRFSPVKRFKDIPAVAYALKNKGLRFYWYIIGPTDNSDEASLFLRNLKQYDVDDCVKWLGCKPNPYPYFKSANLYICLSESEACPMVFKEAQLFGLPIVTTDFPSSYEFVHDGEGFITRFENLADAIESVYSEIKRGYSFAIKGEDSHQLLQNIFNLLD